jgi:hypothetical protein
LLVIFANSALNCSLLPFLSLIFLRFWIIPSYVGSGLDGMILTSSLVPKGDLILIPWIVFSNKSLRIIQTLGSTEICSGWYKQFNCLPAFIESGLLWIDRLTIFFPLEFLVSEILGFSNNTKLFNNSTNESKVI